MPELPEVETVCRGLAKALTGKRITRADVRRPDLRFPFPKNLPARLKGRRIAKIERRAKYILVRLDKNETLALHLGMSGRMVILNKPTKPGLHDHLIFHFGKNLFVHFNDPRRFGLCDLIPTHELAQHKLFRHLGIEPLGKELSAAWLAAKFRSKKTPIKAALLDQRLVVGVGNIYACEALYHARISPKRLAKRCLKEDTARLVPAIRKVLNAAIKAGGSSLRDYVRADGELGYFQHRFAVYDREGKPCPECDCDLQKTGGVKRMAQGGRSTFYCPVRQL
ncbi:MAG: bifunctional DNA-formamidopyrimidine glycosylase/DNA-(apurinic or apyrimidinic site) lyase [Alphaproteobacteria bacterium]|nr:bifunctional DNA-formamidopyrimidine glycosylase/DNA-(apurinic or apyrimidinic site) lyase [Alphaproteobacteria bacterium]